MECIKFSKYLDRIFKIPLAERWDNVGLLIQPTGKSVVNRIFLTIDLTESVLDEAISTGSNFILSYHPPIFHPLKRITQSSWKERIVVKCIENKIAVYSPHTALDCIENGINDWLLSPFELREKLPLKKHGCENIETSVTLPAYRAMQENYVKKKVPSTANFTLGNVRPEGENTSGSPSNIVHGRLEEPLVFTDSEGTGRIGLLVNECSIHEVVNAYKKLLGPSHLKVALGTGKQLDSCVSCIAVCAGSGGSLLTQEPMARFADLLVTGEASHHEQLEAVARGATIITAGHSVSERGYMSQRLKPWLVRDLASGRSGGDPEIQIDVSAMDAEPGVIV